MREYLEPMLGTTGALIAQFVITLAVLLVLILIVFWLIRRFSGGRIGGGLVRGRQPRLAVMDALPIDSRRRLLLVRRDNVEHLILIGGPSDVVVEPSILRQNTQPRRAEPRPAPSAAPAYDRPPEPAPRTESRRPEPEPLPFDPEAEAPLARMVVQATVAQTVIETEASSEEFFRSVEANAPVEPEPAPQPLAPPPVPQPARSRAPERERPAGIPAFISNVRGRQTPTVAREEAAPGRPVIPARPSGRPAPEPLEQRRTGPRSRQIETPPAPPAEASMQQTLEPEIAPPVPAAPVRVPETPKPAVIRQNPLMGGPAARSIPPAPPVVPTEPIGTPAANEDFPDFEPIFDIGPEETARTISGAPTVQPPTREDEPVALADEDQRIEPRLDEDARGQSPAESIGDLEREMARLLGEISNSNTRK